MKYFAGYMGCLGVFLLLMGLVFHAFVLPQIKSRKKSFLEWIMIAVFGLGMLESMAVKPGGGNTPHAPRHSPPQQTVESTNSVEIASTTNTSPWETALAFSYIIQSLMNELSDAKSRPRYSLRELGISTYSKIKNLK